MSYAGYVRVIDANENVLDVAEAALGELDHDGHSWGGVLKVSAGGGLDGKTMPVELEAPDVFRAAALLLPGTSSGTMVDMQVLGEGPSPF
jgi:hypothetical protein